MKKTSSDVSINLNVLLFVAVSLSLLPFPDITATSIKTVSCIVTDI